VRTQKEILNKIEQLSNSSQDFFGFMRSDLVGYLTFKNARPFLNPEVTAKQWDQKPQTYEDIRKEMIDYMGFAWEKANNCRGISAARSMNHYTIWIWLLGDSAVAEMGDLGDYQYYGKDNLVKLCNFLGIDPNGFDDGIRVNSEDE